jgi:hypothetical protein
MLQNISAMVTAYIGIVMFFSSRQNCGTTSDRIQISQHALGPLPLVVRDYHPMPAPQKECIRLQQRH